MFAQKAKLAKQIKTKVRLVLAVVKIFMVVGTCRGTVFGKNCTQGWEEQNLVGGYINCKNRCQKWEEKNTNY